MLKRILISLLVVTMMVNQGASVFALINDPESIVMSEQSLEQESIAAQLDQDEMGGPMGSSNQELETYLTSLGEYTEIPRNPYSGENQPQNLNASEDKGHAYNPNIGAITEDRVLVEYAQGQVLYARVRGGVTLLGDNLDTELAALGISEVEEVWSSSSGEGVSLLSATETIWYCAEISGNVEETVDALKELSGILHAEPNYLYTTDSIGTPTEVEKSSCWWFNDNEYDYTSIGIGWGQVTAVQHEDGHYLSPGEGTIVAVIDTGVDYNHPDLIGSMWQNPGEIADDGVDNDDNGYIDDVFGINTTANPSQDGAKAGDPMDDHGHGTHVAGIIGMSAGNGNGVGIAYGTKIMAIKAGQSTGTFTSAEIVKAIQYAQAMGADVINMSFGGTGRSTLVEEALSDAFSSCVLVASAGNDGLPTTDAPPLYLLKKDVYPAGYDFVIGVMATEKNGKIAGFSNWDYYPNANCEYEIAAPGVDIMSTLPNNRYARWSGTSMAAPCVTAIAAVVRSYYSDKSVYSSRFIYGQLCSATRTTANFSDAYTSKTYAASNLFDSLSYLPKPNLKVAEVFALDSKSIEGNDGDAIIDAGETIDLGISLRNQWGKTTDIVVIADTVSDGGVDNPYVTFINDTVILAPAGTYATTDNGFVWNDSYLESVANPIRVSLSPDTPNDTQIKINLTITTHNGWVENDQNDYIAQSSFTFRVMKGVGVKGTISTDTTWTRDNYYIVENSLLVSEGATLTVEPGTQIQFYSSDYEDAYGGLTMPRINNFGTLNMIGTEDQPIEMFPGAGFEYYCVDIFGKGIENLKYCKIINPKLGVYIDSGPALFAEIDFCDHSILTQNKSSIDNQVFFRYMSSQQTGLIFTSYISPHDILLAISNISNTYLDNISDMAYGAKQTVVFANVNQSIFNHCEIENLGFDPYSKAKSYGVQVSMNNVYVGHYQTVEKGGVSGSSINGNGKAFGAIPTVFPSFSEVFTNSGENSYGKYVFMEPYATSGSYTFEKERELASAVAASLGGSLVSFNSSEEETFIAGKLSEMVESSRETANQLTMLIRTYIGYTFDEESMQWVWSDGSHDYFPTYVNNIQSDYPYAWMLVLSDPGGYNIQRYNASTSNEAYYYYILEFPSSYSDELITAALTDFDYKTWLVENTPSSVKNCAILNPVLDTAPEGWTRFIAPNFSEITKDYYYNIAGNYWGTGNSFLINKMIQDADDFAGNLCDIVEEPILALQSESLAEIYPFVTAIWLEDEEGNRFDELDENVSPSATYEVHVTYNRDMDITLNPMITYGPAAPYTDYSVSGDWITAREWVGSANISPMATDGAQYFRAKGGRAADDRWLVCGTDELRFAFSVSASSAQAMVLQAYGGANKVTLSWVQTDYETLAGYNLYRSTSQDSGFVKLNDAIFTTEYYTDTNVAPGVTYYYYFKVVDTEGVELDHQSNTASGRPLDNIAPNLTHTAVTAAKLSNGVTISAKAGDNIGVTSVTAWYRVANTVNYTELPLILLNDRYTGTIPAMAVMADGVEYYIIVYDADSNYAQFASAGHPQLITVDSSPIISGVSPSMLNSTGGLEVTVYGKNLTTNMTLTLTGSNGEHKEISSFTANNEGLTFISPQLDVGVYDITLTDKSVAAKTVTKLRAITITDETSIAEIGRGEITSGNFRNIPLYISVTGNFTSFSSEILIPSGLTTSSGITVTLAEEVNGFIQSNYIDGVLIIAISGSSNLNPGAGQPLAYINITPNAVTAETTYELHFKNARVNSSDISSLVSGSLAVYPNYSLDATVSYYYGMEKVSGVTITANGVSGQTNTEGVISLIGITRSDVVVFAERKDVNADIAVDAYDASLVLKNRVGLIALDALQLQAADVNSDGLVDETDATLILKKSVHLIEGAYPGSGKTWLFLDNNRAVTLSGDGNNVSFVAILLGDVDGSWGVK